MADQIPDKDSDKNGEGGTAKADSRAEAARGKTKYGSVLFVCTMNAIRSPMAEALGKSLFGRSVYCDSAGIETGDIDGFAVAVMAEAGLDIGAHTAKTLDDLDDIYFDLIITLSPQAHHRVLGMTAGEATEVEYWPIMDPSTVAGGRTEILEAYRSVRDALRQKMIERFGLPDR